MKTTSCRKAGIKQSSQKQDNLPPQAGQITGAAGFTRPASAFYSLPKFPKSDLYSLEKLAKLPACLKGILTFKLPASSFASTGLHAQGGLIP